MKSSYENGLDEKYVENYDEYHFVIETDDGKCLEVAGTKRLSYTKIS